ncbi:TonB C-terminal domain-containing protein [Rariglobus hedericola]|uniref:TonB C-terminal domain-containing protein n=1 Tax=Rariglobus hedericola TaxID=2597822 RepID=A0A556QNB1_9BACT|nr:TonB C-terminal domain-containing protein [Rariglobus hedericola]TSJ78117.1 TonB C-terminal domain-containing protein [Rariglobus hedericola]
MIKPPPSSAQPPAPARRSARSVWSRNSDVRAVQIGVVATILVHVLLLVLAPKIEQWMELRSSSDSAEDWASRDFQIEMAPAEVVPETVQPPKFVEANPNAPDNAPDKTDNVAAQNQQVAQETPTPAGKSDAPASKGDPTTSSTAIVSGMQVEPQPPARRPPPSNEPETPAQEIARREQLPLSGTEKFEGDSADGIGSNVGKPAPNATGVPERVEGVADAKSDTGSRVGLYYKVDAKRPQSRPTLAPDIVKARPSPLANREFGTENIGAVAYNAKWSAYGEYMQKFIESVQIQWQRIIGQSNIYPTAGTKVVVKFIMDSKGDIPKIVSVESSGGRAAKDACVSAIVARAPYGAWPEDMIGVLGTSQEITFTFQYN